MDFVFLILCSLCVVVMSAIITTIYRQYVIRQKLKNLPQLNPESSFIGTLLLLMRMTDFERLKWFLSKFDKLKDGIFVVWLGIQPLVNIYKPEYLEIILSSTINITKGLSYELIKPWLGNGLLTSTGKQWFHDRKLIGPTFHFSILDKFSVVLFEKAEIMTKILEKEIEKNPGKAIDIFPFTINVTLDIICETAMGVNIHAQEGVSEYSSAVHRSSKLVLQRMFRPWYWTDWFYYLMPAGRKYKAVLNVLHDFTKEVIRKKKITRQSQKEYAQPETENNEFDIGKHKRKAFLDLLLDQNEKDDFPLTDDELRAQVDTFMFEGHDTTAVAITWTLFCLGCNLEHQEKVHEELDEVFKDSETPTTVKELSKLKYLERVIKETLRIFPSVPSVQRKLSEDVKIGDYTLPKDTNVACVILLTHRSPEVWSDPLKFDPDRFLPENSKNRNPYAYIPFSAGPRNCIGQKFALLEEKTVLTAILRKWRIKSVKTLETIHYDSSLILRPCEEVLLHFTTKK